MSQLCPLTVSLNKSLSLALPWVFAKFILRLHEQEPQHHLWGLVQDSFGEAIKLQIGIEMEPRIEVPIF